MVKPSRRFSHVRLSETLWIIACQAPLSMGFSRQEYWSGLPCPPPGVFPNPGIKPASLRSLHWQVVSLPIVPPENPSENTDGKESAWNSGDMYSVYGWGRCPGEGNGSPLHGQSFSSVVSDSLQPHGRQHARPPCPTLTPAACSNSCPSSQRCHPTVSPSVVASSSCPQSFPAAGAFPTSQPLNEGPERGWGPAAAGGQQRSEEAGL